MSSETITGRDAERGTELSSERAAAMRALFARVSRNARAIVPINEAAADPKCRSPAFFCVHSLSGAGGTDFVALANVVGADIRVFGVQAPPKRMEDPAFGADVQPMAAVYAEALAEAQPEGPIRLGGWSAGAPIALEVAHQLRRLGREVDLLVAIEGGPEIPHDGLRWWDPHYWLGVLANLPAWYRDSVALKPDFPLGDAVRFVKARAARLRPGRAGADARLRAKEHIEQFGSMDHYPPSHRQFMIRLYDAIMRYRPEPWNGPVVVYEAAITPAITLPQYFRRWRMVASDAERVRLRGNHLTIMRDPLVAQLAEDLKRRLAANRGA
jgi:thioesterase domain-containing protein